MINSNHHSSESIDYLLSPKAIRERARFILSECEKGHGLFEVHHGRLPEAVRYVMKVIEEKYPTLQIPFHSRWGHFRVGGLDREAQLNQLLAQVDPIEKARAKFDLVIPSVLLDAGAGPDWKYNEKQTQKSFSRSEGLGVASYYLFLSGKMNGTQSSHPYQVHAQGLQNISANDIAEAFQVVDSGAHKNPLIGVDGRAQLLRNLGQAVANSPVFPGGRPGHMVDYLRSKFGKNIPAEGLLRAVLDGLGSIWPGRIVMSGVNLGDVWTHSRLAKTDADHSLIPFHKLSQWMTYSLMEPLIEAGFVIDGIEKLTGLAEYRNGGFILDFGLIAAKNPEHLNMAWKPNDDFVIEWRALTICFLDMLAEGVQKSLGRSPQDFPLAKVLEGGTWWAGRKIAAEKRAGGGPPFQIVSDGTVF